MIQAATNPTMLVLYAPFSAMIFHNLWRMYREEHNEVFLNIMAVLCSCGVYALSGSVLHFAGYYILFMMMVSVQGTVRDQREKSEETAVAGTEQ